MQEHVPGREEAVALLKEFNSAENLIKHAYAVEGAMRYFARSMGQDEEKWGVIGLVHDLDYERFPAQHCKKSAQILEERGWPEEYVRAVVSHGWGKCTDVEPRTQLEKVLFAIDELTGLIMAVALVCPSRSLSDLEARSVLKKWKDRTFAAGVDRSVIEKGTSMLGLELNDVIDRTIKGMREVADRIGF
jgi:putative nucleotidyltransferase with HDIG domain